MTLHAPITAEAPVWMPPEAPLDFPAQDLAHRDTGPVAPPATDGPRPHRWRLAIAFGALGLTACYLPLLWRWFSAGGLSALETGVIALTTILFFMIAWSASTVVAGMRPMPAAPQPARPPRPLNVAVLAPIHNEEPEEVFANLAIMRAALAAAPGMHRFAFFVLSDSTDDAIAAREQALTLRARHMMPGAPAIHYRRRAANTDRKSGNIADWVSRWGAGYDAMLVLDADSLMSAEAITALTDTLAGDPSLGLVQTAPRLHGARNLFARLQQFSNAAYGDLFARGLAHWSGRAGNYWGHNAILRTRAFAETAGLPRLGRRKRLILSHDFVEAALMRRAGWGIRLLPDLGGSFERAPEDLIDYTLRDRRWCKGNLQHLRLLATPGLHPVSRMHLALGALSYLASPAWFAILVVWALVGNGAEVSVIRYFNEANPLYPVWPETSMIAPWVLLAIPLALLFAPKFIAAARVLDDPDRLARFGGARRFLASFGLELLASVLYAPILMVQQTLAVVRVWLGAPQGWAPPTRGGGQYGLRARLAFHWLETFAGALLLAGMAAGVVTLWLAPIALSLAAAVPLSMMSCCFAPGDLLETGVDLPDGIAPIPGAPMSVAAE
ncbi:glucans biosynthesis glucosyltransferase MdoH [Maritimibacter sp. 55A14]|uniref:glucans biosynthesis glucosyltransferase MdoH n=1 Tax=Maritimibacter sp. 55A14 TaxID=2174844 RepID=UPI000D60FBE9|nr:glucans biosynthesis glucosyltransferase MdoH [Maritimibacter sp. 55A14]PWE34371.1 glucans biosynthesis glucosyltransferase MdoH [Maritimibacter sp. 55A14]